MAAFLASGVRDNVRPNEPAAVTDQSQKEPQIKTGKFWGSCANITDWSGDGVISLGFHMLIYVTAAK